MKTSITIFIFVIQAWFIPASALNEAPITADTSSKENYSMVGITLGLPGTINFLYGYHFGDFSIRGEIGPLFFIMGGLQANFCYNLSNLKTFESNISIGAGYLHADLGNFLGTIDNLYYGAFYDLNAGGFFFEGGLSFITETGNNKNDCCFIALSESLFSKGQIHLLPLLKLGYVYRFNE